MEVGIVAFDDFTDVDVFLPWDILNRVKLPEWTVKVYGTKDIHHSVTGLTVPVHKEVHRLNEATAVLFASGPGIRKLCHNESYLRQINLNPSRQLIGSMCSGALILGALGLLEGKTATTYPTAKRELEKFKVNVVEEAFVVHENIATAAGCLAAQDLCGWFIERLINKKVKNSVLKSIQPLGQGLSLS